jgi:hypothetical protein
MGAKLVGLLSLNDHWLADGAAPNEFARSLKWLHPSHGELPDESPFPRGRKQAQLIKNPLVHSERFFAHDIKSPLQGPYCERAVEGIRTADVNEIRTKILQQRIHVGIGFMTSRSLGSPQGLLVKTIASPSQLDTGKQPDAFVPVSANDSNPHKFIRSNSGQLSPLA